MVWSMTLATKLLCESSLEGGNIVRNNSLKVRKSSFLIHKFDIQLSDAFQQKVGA